MPKVEQTILKFVAPYMAFNPGEEAGFDPTKAQRLIKSRVAVEVRTATIEVADGPKQPAKVGADDDKPKRRRRGSSSSSFGEE